jgi:hypothetical protein
MLKELILYPVYDSAEYNLINDLIVPLLSNSNSYRRGVGFFTSGWLKLASQGLVQLINNGGKAQIILSPIMEKKDWRHFSLEVARRDEILKDSLLINIENIADGLEKETLNTLSWMIADNILEFKFAVPVDWMQGGDYHDKVALFVDAVGDKVAIHGSFNDSIKGSLNGEAFSVFKSWVEGHIPFVEQHENDTTTLESWQ